MSVPTLAEALREHASRSPDRRGFVMLGDDNVEEDSLTYGELARLADVLAVRLSRLAAPGSRVLLMFPSGLAFVVAFFACQSAGLVPVPVVPPGGRRMRGAIATIAADCRAAVAVTSGALAAQAEAFFAARDDLPRPVVVPLELAALRAEARDAPPARDGVAHGCGDTTAFIQYTSGSTSDPKGVVVSQRNLRANLELMAAAFENDAASTHVGWAPLHHDMGLIANVLQPFHVGALAVLMSPGRFARQPWLWPRAVGAYAARVSGGPNFGYELVLSRPERALEGGLDLSSWRVAFNSAEPVQASTLAEFARVFGGAGFRRESAYPCYGLADATLLVTGGSVHEPPVVRRFSKAGLEQGRARHPDGPEDARVLVGAGRVLGGQTLAIVDPATLRMLEPGRVGEVLVAGPSIPAGYWGRSAADNARVFAARAWPEDGCGYLRTGDLGFVDGSGELFVTGRLKDMFLVRGRNIYPQDIEAIAQAAAPGLRPNGGAAFSVTRDGEQVIALVQEVERARRRDETAPLANAIRRAVFEDLEVTVHDILIVEPGAVPKTSSGKVRRSEAARRYLSGEYARPEEA